MWLWNGRSSAWREATDQASLAEEDARNLKLNLDAGLRLVDFPDDVKPVLRETAVNVILKTASRWVRLCWSALQHVCY